MENRRSFERSEISLKVEYKRPRGGTCRGRSCDISAGGVKLLLSEPVVPGTRVDLKIYFPMPQREEVFECAGVVIWSQPRMSAHLTGVKFDELQADLIPYLK